MGDDEVDCTGVTQKYNGEVSAILVATCAIEECHDAITKSEGYDFSTYASTVFAAKSSKFLKSIKHESIAVKMPKDSDKLSDATIRIIECWAKNGTPE